MDLYHHGILNQKWGVRNGPPYPLSGGQYSASEKKAMKKTKRTYSLSNKKNYDTVIKKGSNIQTLSFDADRTKKSNMYYAAVTNRDKNKYMALFNKPIEDAETGAKTYKLAIKNQAVKNVKVAGESAGSDAFIKLYSKDRNFKNFVEDPERMQSYFVNDKYKFKGYRESAKALDRIRSGNVSENDLRTAYRMFNYVIPNDQSRRNDVGTVVDKFFSELKNEGYSAVLDTNDSIYGGFKADNPVIVFDKEAFVVSSISQTSKKDVVKSQIYTTGMEAVMRMVNSL